MESKEAQTIHKETIVEYKNAHIMPPSCPPQNVICADLMPVYRFIDGEEPTQDDFKSHKELGLGYPKGLDCKATAVSFFTTPEAASKAKLKSKNLIDKKICEGQITKDCGTHQITHKTGHISLWQYKDTNIVNEFIGRR